MFDAIGEGHKIMHEGVKKEIDLDELEMLAQSATPGPWFVTCNCTGKTFYTIKNDRVYIGEALGVYNGEANAAYIVAACNAVPELIARVREMDRQMVWLAKQVCDSLSPQEWINRAEQATKEAGE